MAARAFTALEMHSWRQQGVVMLAKITFAQIVDTGHLEGSHSKRGIPYYYLAIFTLNTFQKQHDYISLLLWLPMVMVCRINSVLRRTGFESARVQLFLPLHL